MIKGATKLLTEIGKKQPTFQAAVFSNKFTLCHAKPNIYIEKTKSVYRKQYLFSLLTSRNENRPKYTTRFFILLKKTRPVKL